MRRDPGVSETVLGQLTQGLARLHAPTSPVDAAVLMALTREAQPRLLLTRRSQRLSAHAGEVAFPGGKCDPGDASVVATALRESAEEVGLAADKIDILGQFGDFVSRAGLRVRAVVGSIPAEVRLAPNPDEIESIFYVPLAFFLDQPPRQDHRVHFMGHDYLMPCYRYQDYVIWGLTAYMLVELLNQSLSAGIDFPMPGLHRVGAGS